MATKKAASKGQMYLIEVGPKNLKQIKPHVKAYREAVEEYSKWGNVVSTEKDAIRNLVHKSGLQRLENGNIEFMCDGMLIKIIPTEEKITITEQKDPQ